MPGQDDIQTLGALLAAIRHAAGGDTVSVADLLAELGDRSFGTALLVPALILVSPLSGIPGVPTVGALIIILIAVQNLLGRDHLWLPGALMRRRVRAARLTAALRVLERPAAWVDRHSRNRLGLLSALPFRALTLLMIIAIAATWPLLELLPLVTTVGALGVTLLAFGMLTRDGFYIAAGYAWVALVGGGVGWLTAQAATAG